MTDWKIKTIDYSVDDQFYDISKGMVVKVEQFINLLNSKNLVKSRKEWNIIKLSIYEKYTTQLNVKVKKYYTDIEKDKKLKKELQNHKIELRNLGFVHWFSSREVKNRKKILENDIYLKTNYISNNLHDRDNLDDIKKKIQNSLLKKYIQEELKFIKSKLSKEQFKENKLGIEYYILIKYPIKSKLSKEYCRNYKLGIDNFSEMKNFTRNSFPNFNDKNIIEKVVSLLSEHDLSDINNSHSNTQKKTNIKHKKGKTKKFKFDKKYYEFNKIVSDIYKEGGEYKFIKMLREKLKKGEVYLEEMGNYIKTHHKKYDGGQIMTKIHLYNQLEQITTSYLEDWEKKKETTFEGFIDVEQYHSLSQKIVNELEDLLQEKLKELGK